uniref:Variant surface glycoprotein 1125.4070 n=1 Tax=Trypanosoma brucei TaxID=5691 RepID=A0A1J0R9T7_9TRYP|nr:variant surface glycoprotein 1125.4070 [Trypanosoma brucei]
MLSAFHSLGAVALLTATLPNSDAAAGANAAAHVTMCELLNLAKAGGQVDKPKNNPRTSLEHILDLNMSVSDKQWSDEFKTEPGPGQTKDFPNSYKQNEQKKHWETSWPMWFEAKRRAEQKKIGKPDGTEHRPIVKESQKKAARAIIQQIADKATILESQYTALASTGNDFGQAAAEQHLNKALTGEPTGSTPATPNTIAAIDTWANGCAPNSATKSILATFSCICISSTGSNTNECYNNAVSLDWSTQLNLQTALAQLTESCNYGPLKPATPEAIEAALATFRATAKTTGTGGTVEVTIGDDTGGGCDGATTKMCIKFGTLFRNAGSKGWGMIDWYNNLQKAAAELKKAQHTATQAAALATAIDTLKQEADATYKAAAQSRLTELDQATAKTSGQASGRPDTSTTKPNENCEDKAQENCTGICAYNKTEGKCKLTEKAQKEAEKANQEKGEKDGNKDRCTKHGTYKTKCEAENTAGQPPVCGFRKGKEGETDEPDKEKCRNGSFLVTKKFALSVVSAAFTALLF